MVASVAGSDENGYASPEAASCADIPPRFVTVVGTEIDGDSGKERPILDGMSAVRTPFPAAGFGAV